MTRPRKGPRPRTLGLSAETYRKAYTPSVIARIVRANNIPEDKIAAFRDTLAGAYVAYEMLGEANGPYDPGAFATRDEVEDLRKHLERALRLLKRYGVKCRLDLSVQRTDGDESEGWVDAKIEEMTETVARLATIAQQSRAIDGRKIIKPTPNHRQ